MKLNEVKPYLETSGDLEEQFFSVQDPGMLFEILRKKMYSNPILAICREISCNARDAHREVGTPDVPIVIHLPNNLERYYKVKDFGPGISPDRMSNVFIKYTASTKRNDNLQTGGFGLGAKTPFSYSDSFSIVTNFNGVQYSYSCNIDETKVGKLLLMSESPTNEPNGTEIQIPVLPKNFQEFATWTEQACRHWRVKPTIKGAELKWQEPEKLVEGNGWAVVDDEGGGYHNRDCKIIIDEIEYPLDLETLKKYADASMIDSSRGKFLFYFGIGELSLSANREQLYLDERTQALIKKRLLVTQTEIRQKVNDKIAAFPNLWEANLYFRKDLKKAFHNINFLGTFSWQGIELNESYINAGCPIFSFTKGKYSRKYGTNNDKLSRSSGQHFYFEENGELYINDLPIKEPTPRHVKAAFEKNPSLKTLYVICPTDKITEANLNDKIHLDKMAPKKLSDITKATGRAYTPASARLLVFKFDLKACSWRQVSYASLEEDTATKVLCTLTKETYPVQRQAMLASKKILSLQSLKTLSVKNPGFSFYGVDTDAPAKRVEEDFSDFEDINEFIKDNVLESDKIDYMQLKYATRNVYACNSNRLLRDETKLTALIKDPNSLYCKRAHLHKKIKAIAETDKGLLDIYEAVNGEITDSDLAVWIRKNPDLNVEQMRIDYESKYPLLGHVQTYNIEDILTDIAHYINLIDRN